jgi:hypothetical protein
MTPDRMTRVGLLAFEDQLLAVLRDAHELLSTREVAERAGPAALPPDALTARRLRMLAARGQIHRHTIAGHRQAYWRATPKDPNDETLDQLKAALHADGPDGPDRPA